MGEGYEHTLFKKKTSMRPTNMKKCSSSLIIREMQIKTTLRYHLTPARMVIIKTSPDAGEVVEKKEHFYTVGGRVISSTIVEDGVAIPQGPRNRNSI